MTTTNHEREASYWRSEADRQRERADVLERELERTRGLLDVLIGHIKAQVGGVMDGADTEEAGQ
jgi:S-adenosylmethionine:diacylglycerol 3-amino-3-carboxypropyl transferase